MDLELSPRPCAYFYDSGGPESGRIWGAILDHFLMLFHDLSMLCRCSSILMEFSPCFINVWCLFAIGH